MWQQRRQLKLYLHNKASLFTASYKIYEFALNALCIADAGVLTLLPLNP